MSKKKVIEQEDSGRPNIVIQRNQNNGSYLLKSRGDDGIIDMIVILSENSTTVAKAIDPEYQKVIDHYEFAKRNNIETGKFIKSLKDQVKDLQEQNKYYIKLTAKLVKEFYKIYKELDRRENLSDFSIPTETVRILLDEALQNTKNIEG